MPRKRTFGTHEIHAPWWDPHEIVIIREFNSDDDDWITDQAASMEAGSSDMKWAQGTVRRMTLVRGIVSWTFTDERNVPMPWPALSRDEDPAKVYKMRDQILRTLDPKDSAFIYGEVNKRNQAMTSEEADTFFENASNGSKGSQETSPLPS